MRPRWLAFCAVAAAVVVLTPANPVSINSPGAPPEAKRDNGNILWDMFHSTFWDVSLWNTISSQIHALELLADTEKGLTCELCRFGITLLRDMAKKGRDKEEIKWAANLICLEFKLATKRVCKGVIDIMSVEAYEVLQRTKLSSHQICTVLLGDECLDAKDPFQMWNVTYTDYPKPPVKTLEQPKGTVPTFRVLQLSDVHYDPQYKIGSSATCNEPICCRDMNSSSQFTAGKWGAPSNCDTPLITLENMLEHLSKNDKFDYILWTGDLPPHDIWNQTISSQLEVITTVTDLMSTYFPNTPIFPALGNHEGVPVNSFPPDSLSSIDSMAWLYDKLAVSWPKFTRDSTTMKTIKSGAFYTTLIKPGFRIVSINTNYCNNLNWWLMINMTDPNNEIAWLINVLQEAENNEELVHIIAHIPTGTDDCLKGWSWNYYNIISRYESTVRGQFFGHTHKDSFTVFYDNRTVSSNDRRPVSVAYVAPSVTPFENLYPGYRVYTVDGDRPNTTFTVLDHETYILNLTEVNVSDKPVWIKEYSAKEAYKMPSLLPEDWDALIGRLNTNDNLFKQYYRYYFKSMQQSSTCDVTCKDSMLCELVTGRSHDDEICQHLPTGYETIRQYHRNRRSC